MLLILSSPAFVANGEDTLLSTCLSPYQGTPSRLIRSYKLAARDFLNQGATSLASLGSSLPRNDILRYQKVSDLHIPLILFTALQYPI